MPPSGFFDLVREVADQLHVGLRLLEQASLALHARLLLQRQQLDQAAAGLVGWRDQQPHMQRLVVRATQQVVQPDQRELVVAGAGQGVLQQLGRGQPARPAAGR